jgi:photosystem II stability/assembly factor-like uncharacterized protein
MKKVIFILSFLLLFADSYSQWFYQNNPDSISVIMSGTFINSNTGWYARSKGEISRTTDGGLTWNTYKADVNDLNSIKFVNANTGYVCGNNGRLLKSVNGGLNWAIQNPSSNDTLVSIDFINELTGWCAGRDFIIYTSNGGSQWYRQNVDTNTVKPQFTILKMYDNLNGIAGAYRKYASDLYAYIYRTSNGGANWQFIDSVYGYHIYSICYVNQNIVFLSNFRNLYKSINGGSNWNSVYSFIDLGISKIYFSDENTGWYCKNNSIYKTLNGGLNWNASVLNIFGVFRELNYTSNGNIFVTTSKGTVVKTTNDGLYWSNYSVNIESYLFEINIVDANNIFIGGNGTFCKTTNGGLNWQFIFRDSIYYSGEPIFLNPNTGFLYLQRNIYKTINGGDNWVPAGSTFPHTIHHMACLNENNLWVVGDSGMIMKSTNSGNSWINKSVNDSLYVFKININNNNIFASTIGRILKSNNSGDNWVEVPLDTLYPFYNIYFLNSQIGWVIPTGEATIYKTVNGGNNWNKYYRQIENYLVTNRCSFIDEYTGYAASLDPNRGLLKTTNSGLSWFIVTTFPVLNNIYMTNNVSFLNENTGWVIGSHGLILKTTNAGTSFIAVNNQIIPDKYFLSQNYPNPFNPTTKIRFTVPHFTKGVQEGVVTLKVYDILGKEIATLVNEKLGTGEYEITFDARHGGSSRLTSGIYFYRLVCGDFSETKKMLMIK